MSYLDDQLPRKTKEIHRLYRFRTGQVLNGVDAQIVQSAILFLGPDVARENMLIALRKYGTMFFSEFCYLCEVDKKKITTVLDEL